MERPRRTLQQKCLNGINKFTDRAKRCTAPSPEAAGAETAIRQLQLYNRLACRRAPGRLIPSSFWTSWPCVCTYRGHRPLALGSEAATSSWRFRGFPSSPFSPILSKNAMSSSWAYLSWTCRLGKIVIFTSSALRRPSSQQGFRRDSQQRRKETVRCTAACSTTPVRIKLTDLIAARP